MREWFRRTAESLGELYEGALGILFSEVAFPGRVRFVAHAVREIRNRLPDVIAGPKEGGQLQYVNRMDQLCDIWKGEGLPEDGTLPVSVLGKDSPPTALDVPVPRRVYVEVAGLVRDHLRAREKRAEAARRLFEAIDPNNQSAEAMLRPRVQHWLEVTEWFVRRAHDNGLTDADCGAPDLQERFEIFEIGLLALTTPFFEGLRELDEILEDANS